MYRLGCCYSPIPSRFPLPFPPFTPIDSLAFVLSPMSRTTSTAGSFRWQPCPTAIPLPSPKHLGIGQILRDDFPHLGEMPAVPRNWWGKCVSRTTTTHHQQQQRHRSGHHSRSRIAKLLSSLSKSSSKPTASHRKVAYPTGLPK